MEQITNVDAIMSPNEAFSDYKKYLLGKYVEDYGEDKYSLMRKRMDHTIYLFNSPPPYKMQFIVDHFNEISDYREVLRIEAEFQDYMKVRKRIENDLRRKFYDEIASYFHIANGKIRYEELVDLDFDSFSSKSLSLLANEEVDEKVKESILRRQEKYKKTCRMYYLEPITDCRIIDHLKRYEARLNAIMGELLIKYSKWGKRIQKEINSQSKIKVTEREIAKIVFCDKTASTSTITKGEKCTVLCYFPVMKVSDIGELDRLFFHENRHVVETNRNFSGIDDYHCSKYTMLNEVRTEKNAGIDAQSFAEIPLFSNASMGKKYFNCYQAVFPYTEDFFEQYREVLNGIAIENDISMLEHLYGEDNLVAFNNYLNDIEQAYIDNGGPCCLPVDQEKQKQLVFQLQESYRSKK